MTDIILANGPTVSIFPGTEISSVIKEIIYFEG
jgi:hypothetical protein